MGDEDESSVNTEVLNGKDRQRNVPQGCTEGTSDNVLSGGVDCMCTQGGELEPVAQEAPVILACVHDEPTEEPAPSLLPKGLLNFPLSHIVTDVYQLDEEDVGHARCDDHRVPHTGEGQSRAVEKGAFLNILYSISQDLRMLSRPHCRICQYLENDHAQLDLFNSPLDC